MACPIIIDVVEIYQKINMGLQELNSNLEDVIEDALQIQSNEEFQKKPVMEQAFINMLVLSLAGSSQIIMEYTEWLERTKDNSEQQTIENGYQI